MNSKYEYFCRALANLETGSSLPGPWNIVEKTGIAALFEICFEQSWKLVQDILLDHGFSREDLRSPRAVIKLAWKVDMITDEETWLDMMGTRNLLAHTYSDELAENIISQVKGTFVPAFKSLKNEIDTRWNKG